MVAKTRKMIAIGSVSKSPHTLAAIDASEDFEWCAKAAMRETERQGDRERQREAEAEAEKEAETETETET
eukprot:COSAG03_NODE_3025_length_2280_cov_6.983952_4_plen_70_part_00